MRYFLPPADTRFYAGIDLHARSLFLCVLDCFDRSLDVLSGSIPRGGKTLAVTELGAAVGGEHAAKMTTDWEGP